MPYWTTWGIDDTIENIIGGVATGITFVLFASPIKTLIAIHQAGSTQAFRGDPFIYTFFNCTLWVIYCIYQGGLLMPLVCNIVGMTSSASYVIFFAYYLPSSLEPSGLNTGKTEPVNHPRLVQAYTTRRNYLLQLFGLLAVVALIGGLLNLPVFDFDVGDQNFPAWMFGLMADIFNVIMYGSPLAMMKTVITTKSVKFMPFLFSFFTTWCTASWVVYGIYVGDIWITIPNVSGLLLGIAQLVLYGIYSGSEQGSKYKPLKESEDPTSPRRVASSEAVAEDDTTQDNNSGDQDDDMIVYESPK